MTINIKGQEVLVDDEDYEKINKYKWRLLPTNNSLKLYIVYNKRYKKKDGKWSCKFIRLHRFVMNCSPGLQVDHINGNTFDNRKCNLRICTLQQNSQNKKIPSTNTSGYKGVTWDKYCKKWKAQIGINNKIIYLGRYFTIEEAYETYCAAACKYHKKFANFG